MGIYVAPGSEAAGTLRWVESAYSDISSASGEEIELLSPSRSQAELRLIWKAAVANEANATLRAGDRRAVLDLLLS
jgi:hypothetical protein